MPFTTFARGLILGPLFGLVLAATVEANSIQSIALVGEGCPSGSVGQSSSPDGSNATLIFDSFVATAGPGLLAGDSAKDCVLQIELAADDAALVTIDSRGFVQLPTGVSAVQQSHVPRAKHSLNATSFFGPVAKDYFVRNVVTVLPIGSAGNPKFLIVLNIELDTTANPTAQAQITLDSIDLKIAVPPTP
jgi:hypothetical protein